MNGHKAIATPYSLPFRVLVQPPPLLRGGNDVALTVVPRNPLTAGDISIFDGFLDAFWGLAITGALCGDSLPPWISTIKDKSDPIRESGSFMWVFTGCELDEAGLITLVHLLLAAHETKPLSEVRIGRAVRPGQLVPLKEDPRLEDPYPMRWPEILFVAQVEPPVTDSITIRTQFKVEPTPQQVEDIETDLLAWAAAASVGAYAVPPLSPMATYVEPELQVEVTGAELTWGMHKIRLHPAAFDGLWNIFLSIDRRVASIRGLQME